MKFSHKVTLAGLVVSLIGQIPAVYAHESWTLDKVVSLTRHGVRPQTETKKLDKATGLKWPAFGVEDGLLTGHGYSGMWSEGHYLLNQWHKEGLAIDSNCQSAQQLFMWSSPSPRIKSTGKALADGMFPGCGIQPVSIKAKYDPLFELYHLNEAHPDKAIMKQQMLAKMGNLAELKTRYQPAVEQIRKSVCAPDSCKFLDQPWGIKFKDTGKPVLEGPGKMGATIGETVRLQYSDNLPYSQVAFGHGNNADTVKALMALHAAQYNFMLDTPEFAAHSGSLLMRQILSAITSGTTLHSQWPGDTRLNRPLVMLLGHDTNIAEIQTMLGFDWTLPSYPSNDVPPGATLSLARFHQGNNTKEYVRIRFEARTLDQWRTLSPLNSRHPMPHADLNFKGCKHTAVGTLCPLDAVVKRASHLLVNDGMSLPVFNAQ